LTDEEFGRVLEEQSKRKETEAAEKSKRTADREAQQVAKAALEEEWKKMKADHGHKVGAWKLECERLRGQKVRVEDLPAKPKMPCKPTLPVLESNSQQEPGNEFSSL
jgi:hypothetical protein